MAQIYFELNDTDGDLGIHGLIDGDAWRSLEIEGPGELELMNVWLRTGLRRQGLTEFFFESAEPPFDELSPAAFLNRFKPGIYEIGAVSLDGVEFEEEVRVSHVLAGQPREYQGQWTAERGKLRRGSAGGQFAGDDRLGPCDDVSSDHRHAQRPGQCNAVPVRLRGRARRQGSRKSSRLLSICRRAGRNSGVRRTSRHCP